MKMRIGLALIAAVGLSACAERDVVLNTPYVTDFGTYQDIDNMEKFQDFTGENAEKASWSGANEITLTLRQNEFSPMIVHLKKNVPYVLTVKNNDHDTVSFRANEFFENVSVSEINEAKHEDDTYEAAKNPVLMSFVVPPMGERTVKLVPVMEGRYEFEDGAPGIMFPRWQIAPWSRGATMGTAGVFVVE